jgi:hypothetical protein
MKYEGKKTEGLGKIKVKEGTNKISLWRWGSV